MFTLSCPISAATRVPLPGDSGPPRVELGKVNVFGVDELPPMMRDQARQVVKHNAASPNNVLDFDAVDEDDWEWPRQSDALYPSHASMNQGRVLIVPRDITPTELATYRFLGIGDNTANPGEPVLTVCRYFERPDKVLVTLTENKLDGNGAAVMVRELIHDWVGPWPAVFTVQRAPSGRVRSMLDWTTDGTDYTLMVLDDVRQPRGSAIYDKAWLFRLARSIDGGAG